MIDRHKAYLTVLEYKFFAISSIMRSLGTSTMITTATQSSFEEILGFKSLLFATEHKILISSEFHVQGGNPLSASWNCIALLQAVSYVMKNGQL